MPVIPKSIVYALLAIGLAVLAGDFLVFYIPFSGWVLQAIIIGVYLEYLGVKKTIFIVALMKIFFLSSYGGATAVAVVVSIFDAKYSFLLIGLLYAAVVLTVLFLGFLTNCLFHKIRLFERINKTAM